MNNTSAAMTFPTTTRLTSTQNVMLGGLCAMYLMTYVDRVNLSTAAPVLQHDLGLTTAELGLIFSAFAVPYGFLQPIGGWLGDRYGPRWVLFGVGVLWAGATTFTGLATGFATLFLARLFLGFGEGAAFPTATKAMAIWFPARKRAFAQGVTHSFSRIGNAITPPIVGWLMVVHSWRMAFFVLGAVSLIWVTWWVFFFRDQPHKHPGMTAQALAELPPCGPAIGTWPGARCSRKSRP